MPRIARIAEPELIYHVLNRGNCRQKIFNKAGDYHAFLEIISQDLQRFDVQLMCWCLMPNHWHLVVRPMRDKQMAKFMHWLTLTHVRRYYQHYGNDAGHLYQGRYKSFPVQDDSYFLTLCRYVEGNAFRSNMVKRAEDWQWSSLYHRVHRLSSPPMTQWPIDRPRRWLELVNEPVLAAEAELIRVSIERGRPLGPPDWVRQTARRLGLLNTLIARGRPRKSEGQISARTTRRRQLEAHRVSEQS
jgi:putative transposase